MVAISVHWTSVIHSHRRSSEQFFPVGETLVTYTATDASGGTAFWTQRVTVVDNTPPLISAAVATPATLWPRNGEMIDVMVNYDVADNCAILETTLSVSSNEPVSAGAGSDWESMDAHHVRLRAHRWARWGERVYTITITTRDVHGNTTSQNLMVRVPQRGKGAGKRE